MTYKPFCDYCKKEIPAYVVRLTIEAKGSGCVESAFYTGRDGDFHEACVFAWVAAQSPKVAAEKGDKSQ